MAAEELKPCPFCEAKSEDIVVIEENFVPGIPEHSYCYCTICGAQSGHFSAVESRLKANSRAVKRWNRRPDAKVENLQQQTTTQGQNAQSGASAIA